MRTVCLEFEDDSGFERVGDFVACEEDVGHEEELTNPMQGDEGLATCAEAERKAEGKLTIEACLRECDLPC